MEVPEAVVVVCVVVVVGIEDVVADPGLRDSLEQVPIRSQGVSLTSTASNSR